MILPSKELLSEVLEINDINLIIYDIDFPNIIEYTQYANITRGVRSTEINIYELSHKMKEWACEQGYCIIQDTRGFTKVAKYGSDKRKFWEDENMDKAIERIFEACEWIYKGNK